MQNAVDLQVHRDSGMNCLNFEEGRGARVIDTCPFTVANKTQQVLCEGNSIRHTHNIKYI